MEKTLLVFILRQNKALMYFKINQSKFILFETAQTCVLVWTRLTEGKRVIYFMEVYLCQKNHALVNNNYDFKRH